MAMTLWNTNIEININDSHRRFEIYLNAIGVKSNIGKCFLSENVENGWQNSNLKDIWLSLVHTE